MANNYNPCTMSPFISKTLVSDKDMETLSECQIECEVIGSHYYFYAQFGINNEEEAIKTFQKIIRKSKKKLLYVSIHGCSYCDKMRSDNFSGFATFITARSYKYIDTMSWVDKQITKAEHNYKKTKIRRHLKRTREIL